MSPLTCPTKSVDIVAIHQNALEFSLVNEIQRGISPPAGTPRSMPTMLLYNDQGLKLFEEITYLEEYYLTNAEIEVLRTHAKRIVERIPDNAQLLELGSGNLRKVEILLREFESAGKHVDYYALDLSLPELQRTFSEISIDDFTHVEFHGLHGTYDDAMAWLDMPENRKLPTVIMSMGSSIGNFDRPSAASFLGQFARLLGPDDLMIIGLDACSDPDKVFRAYNDSKGITRQFYENGLVHANAVLGYEAFKLEDWDVITDYNVAEGTHRAFYAPKHDVTINGTVIKQGEKLIFEEAYKYSATQREQLWHDAGLIHKVEYENEAGEYHLHILSSAVLNYPTKPSQYAAGAVPTYEEFRKLWTAWDIVTRSMVPREKLLSKPIKLRNALIFYFGHIPTFLDIHLTRALGDEPTYPKSYQLIFERGIDPDVDNPEHCHSHSEVPDEWPPLDEILDYQERVRSRVRSIYQKNDLVQDRTLGEALWIGFEHEAMHLETFLYMLIQSERINPPPAVPKPDFERIFRDARERERSNDWFTIPEQTLSIGLDDDGKSVPSASYAWDNEKPARVISVQAFQAQGRPITNGEYARYLQANSLGQKPESWIWTHPKGSSGVVHGGQSNGHATKEYLAGFAVRTVFGPVPLEYAQDWPVIASYDELAQYAQWMGCRIPSFEEVKSIYAHAARLNGAKQDLPNGYRHRETSGVNGHGNGVLSTKLTAPAKPSHDSQPMFVDLDDCNVGFKHWHPSPVIQHGNRLAGHGELGGVWEWTSSTLERHEGFEAMEIYPGYTSDFFDGKHNIILGGSWATHPRIAGRTTFVNWYQRNYPYPWAGARLVRDFR
ncbi:hypothetical protein ASPACDRAFT_123798 [Aspergillus aculeatus ATCC 16872]|uniref:N-methyltransferase n=1 Tax=Aspergillus aculeatus (strain ATCC 16872 / CBS 172.66 / WB 5094) TaxID=690307 RepID=A0A1L9WLU9_ASPA1|nr:uncharacterized protein ASPACDRAFT_123798 [Aspergillus aculeatus ATCC 16872]OJJ97070.1 hypothetical protein ASPACDRAFT_123798 [Aspergillus aculeatus ATCC 16872]